jgi:hypothetical protein
MCNYKLKKFRQSVKSIMMGKAECIFLISQAGHLCCAGGRGRIHPPGAGVAAATGRVAAPPSGRRRTQSPATSRPPPSRCPAAGSAVQSCPACRRPRFLIRSLQNVERCVGFAWVFERRTHLQS